MDGDHLKDPTLLMCHWDTNVQARIQLHRRKSRKRATDGKHKCSLNKERQIERGGRDGNGKKDEVIPAGSACVGLPDPAVLLHLLLAPFLPSLLLSADEVRGTEVRCEGRKT